MSGGSTLHRMQLNADARIRHHRGDRVQLAWQPRVDQRGALGRVQDEAQVEDARLAVAHHRERQDMDVVVQLHSMERTPTRRPHTRERTPVSPWSPWSRAADALT